MLLVRVDLAGIGFVLGVQVLFDNARRFAAC